MTKNTSRGRTLGKALFSLISVLAPAVWATPVYDLANLHDEKLAGLDGWGMKVENLFGEGAYGFSFNDPGGAQFSALTGTNQLHLLAQLRGTAISGTGLDSHTGIYTLNVMFDDLSVTPGGAALSAGFSNGGHYVVGTLTAPGGEVFHLATAAGAGGSFSMAGNAAGDLEAVGSLRFCTDAACSSLSSDMAASLALSARCAADSDCTGLPVTGPFALVGAGPGPTFNIAVPDGGQDSEVPEPDTMALAGLALIALGAIRRRAVQQ